MDETRVDRYKEYRKSFIKEGSIVLESSEEDTLDVSATTSTLPMDSVIDAVQGQEQEAAFLKHKRQKANLKIILEVAVVVLLLAGLVVLGIFAWGR